MNRASAFYRHRFLNEQDVPIAGKYKVIHFLNSVDLTPSLHSHELNIARHSANNRHFTTIYGKPPFTRMDTS